MVANLKKAYYYLKKNGIEDTVYASLERLIEDRESYTYQPITQEMIQKQKETVFERRYKFSILVPTYETNRRFLREMIDSVLAQTYGEFELIIADASRSNSVADEVASYDDRRILYYHLTANKGISVNTNEALLHATGDYIGLLDHDDLLTPDALYECNYKLNQGYRNGLDYVFIYSNEDKCDSQAQKFFEPNYKPSFNLDLLLTNNYICHFLVMRADVMKSIAFRPAYDGAQDHDIVLRAYSSTHSISSKEIQAYGHIPKVLYHWRCHDASTASNPQSKQYAYDAGKRAVEDFLKNEGITASVEHTKHNGFYRVKYSDLFVYPEGSIQKSIRDKYTEDTRGEIAYITLLNRYDIGAIGGPIIRKNKITGGIIDETKTCLYDGLDIHYSGYMHRAVLQQSCIAVDVRNMLICEALVPCLVKIASDEEYMHLFNHDLICDLKDKCDSGSLNVPYVDVTKTLCDLRYDDIDYLNASVALGREIMLEGYLNYYEPQCAIVV